MSQTRAYKFLRPGRVAPFTGVRWPEGGWVDDVSACERRQLPLWICEELWEVELAGDVERRARKLRGARGRLRRRIDPWSPATAKTFAATCAWRAALHASGPLAAAGEDAAVELFREGDDLDALWAAGDELCDRLDPQAGIPAGMARDGARRALNANASDDPYVAAHGAAVAAYIAASTAWRVAGLEAFEAERAWQAERLAAVLELA